MLKFFNSEANKVPFNQQTVDRINGWVNDKTHGKIKKVIRELRPSEVLVLVNAVYFKGDWTKPFDKDLTQVRDFTLSDSSKVKVPLMYKQTYFDYQETAKFQAVRLPFGKGDTAMTFILPKKSLNEFQNSFSDSEFQKIQTEFSRKRVQLYVPFFCHDVGIRSTC